MTITAPVAAPDETPSMLGLASGLRTIAWMVIPVAASVAPTTAARMTRGILVWMTMVSYAGRQSGTISQSPVAVWMRMRTAVPAGIATEPNINPRIPAPTSSAPARR